MPLQKILGKKFFKFLTDENTTIIFLVNLRIRRQTTVSVSYNFLDNNMLYLRYKLNVYLLQQNHENFEVTGKLTDSEYKKILLTNGTI